MLQIEHLLISNQGYLCPDSEPIVFPIVLQPHSKVLPYASLISRIIRTEKGAREFHSHITRMTKSHLVRP